MDSYIVTESCWDGCGGSAKVWEEKCSSIDVVVDKLSKGEKWISDSLKQVDKGFWVLQAEHIVWYINMI